MRNGLLVRVGIDSSYGQWNGPIDQATNRFLYVPIPEAYTVRPGLERRYADLRLPCADFNSGLPQHLHNQLMHLDPDFDHLTYGDGGNRANPIRNLKNGDFVVFYAGLRPLDGSAGVVNAIIGYFEVSEVAPAAELQKKTPDVNAHCRRREVDDDVVVIARRRTSGRMKYCIPIGEWRAGSYRITKELLNAWGGLSVLDGYIQRSGTLPRFLEPDKFLRWFRVQGPELVRQNNPETHHYIYKVTHDTGCAPCVDDGLLTLAICKPDIRSTADIGDWIYGFGGAPYGGKLIYVAQVTGRLAQGDYYRRAEFRSRSDCIYQWQGDKLTAKARGAFHADNVLQDIGKSPDYPRANVLVSSNFRYLGKTAQEIDRVEYPELRKLVAALKRGHRVRGFTTALRWELHGLRKSLWARGSGMVLGAPHDLPPSSSTCC